MTATADPSVANAWGGERKSSVALFVGRGIAAGLSFLVNLYLAKALGADSYGTYSFAIGLLTFIGIFFDLGYFSAAARLIASASGELEHDYTGAVYVLGLIFSVVFAGLVFIASQVSDHLFHVKVASILLAIVYWSPAMIAPYLFEQTLKATGRLYLLSVWTIATKVFFVGLLALTVMRHNLSPRTAAVAQMVGGVAAILIVLASARPKIHDIRARLRDIQQEQARFGRPLYVGKIAQLGSYHTDKLLLAYFATAREVGWYMLAMAIAGFVSMFAQAVAASGFRGFSRLRPISRELRRWNTFGILVSSVGIVVGATVVIRFYLGSEYHTVPLLLVPAVVATGFQAAFQPYNSWLLANGFGIELRRLLFIVAGVNAVSNLALIPSFGVFGAAVASILGMSTYWYLAKRAYHSALTAPVPAWLGSAA